MAQYVWLSEVIGQKKNIIKIFIYVFNAQHKNNFQQC